MEAPYFYVRREALIAQIANAFASVTRDEGATLHEAMAIDDRKTPQEQRAARRFDRDERWQDVPDTVIAASGAALNFLDAKGFRYYLPAFMIYELKNWENSALFTSSSCRLLNDHPHSLRKSEPAVIAARFGFDGAQCRAVAAFLRLEIDSCEILASKVVVEAVKKWETYCESNP